MLKRSLPGAYIDYNSLPFVVLRKAFQIDVEENYNWSKINLINVNQSK